ncbi:FAD-binding oxidoreductase [Pseudoalteromonas luteoviolacea]|uniref:FAD-binding oxidoreductase n=1 Tax=Pseudoalteromonas luteoviolacea TaxID=43657 RepID=UPI00114DAB10|nr:FAD-binding oxidoreductase [Pseudoalteromonas luteoviolacea]TQF70026.1 NAD(P)H-flavin reductase [Pseudoalteromonas luteoviolacea]
MKNDVKTPPVAQYDVCVTKIESLNKHTFEIELLAPEGTILHYKSGQYLKLELDVNNDGKPLWLSYTISSRLDADKPNKVSLIIQVASDFSGKVVDCLFAANANNQSVKIMLAMGKAFLQTNLEQPHLFVAAGSGISKIKCITEEILHRNPDANINIYWSNRHNDDFFLLEQFHSWAAAHKNLNFTTILESVQSDWTGRTGFLYEVIQQDHTDLNETQAYLCGSPKMVYGTIDQLNALGLQERNCYSDVFEFSPRAEKLEA